MTLLGWRKILVLSLLLASLGSEVAAQEAASLPKPSSTAIMVDVPVRVLGLGLTLVSGVMFVIASPFAYASDSLPETWDALVIEPLEFTFLRPMGQFENWKTEPVQPER